MLHRPTGNRARTITLIALGLAACSGGDDPPANMPPAPVITSPAAGSTFRAGDTLTFSGSGTDAEDGTLGSSRMVWFAELHHDTHHHPFHPETAGASGTVTIPTRGETSDNIFYRFHLRATDSAGVSSEVTRDVVPQKSQVTLASQPAGLRLTLDGQPVTAPHSFTGVVGVERDLGAASQSLDCRNYQFSTWSPGGASATRTISTPSADTTYTATFIDSGPAGNLPTVALTAPANNSTGTVGVPITLAATATDSDGSIAGVQFFDGSTPIGAADTSAPYSVSWTPASAGTHTLTARASDNCGSSATSAVVTVMISASTGDTQPPTVAFTAPGALQANISGNLTITANVTDNVGAANVEFQVDGVTVPTDPSSPDAATVNTSLYASGQHVLRVRASDSAGNTSNWVTRTVHFGGSRVVPNGFTRDENFATGLSQATAFAQLPDGRLLVAQQGGTLLVRQSNGAAIGPMLTVGVDPSGERGLLGVAPHPDFASNGFIYIYYTTTESVPGAMGTHNRISRFTVSGDSASGEVKLIELPVLSGATNHNGGALHFGNDGKLYVAVGDNADSSKAPNLSDPFGKMLRFNDDGAIPSDNPFCTTPGNLICAIWARGLRNPFTFAVRASDGRMHINDVGQVSWEEINLGVEGADYGWPSTEGPTSASGVTGPLFAYDHFSSPDATGGFFSGFAIAGGAFYPAGGMFGPPWRGGYFFADHVNRYVGFIDLNSDNAAYAFASLSGEPVGVLAASDGALLVLTRGGITRITRP